MSDPDPVVAQGGRPRKAADRRQRARLAAAAVIGAIVTAFAVVNLDDVKVHWLVSTGNTPLILVIVVAFVLGIIVDRLLLRAQRRRRSAGSSAG